MNTDLWLHDDNSEYHRAVTAVRLATTQVWPFLAAATDPEDYQTRRELVMPQLETEAVRCSAPGFHEKILKDVLASYDRDWGVLLSAREAKLQNAYRSAVKKDAGSKEAAYQGEEASHIKIANFLAQAGKGYHTQSSGRQSREVFHDEDRIGEIKPNRDRNAEEGGHHAYAYTSYNQGQGLYLGSHPDEVAAVNAVLKFHKDPGRSHQRQSTRSWQAGLNDPAGQSWTYHEGGEDERHKLDRAIVDNGGHVSSEKWAHGHIHEFSDSAKSAVEARGHHSVSGKFPGTRKGITLSEVKRLTKNSSRIPTAQVSDALGSYTIDAFGHIKQSGSSKKVAALDDIVGYTYNAGQYHPSCMIKHLVHKGELSNAMKDLEPEEALDQHAEGNGIDRMDESSYDSSQHPKVVFRDQAKDNAGVAEQGASSNSCDHCGEKFYPNAKHHYSSRKESSKRIATKPPRDLGNGWQFHEDESRDASKAFFTKNSPGYSHIVSHNSRGQNGQSSGWMWHTLHHPDPDSSAAETIPNGHGIVQGGSATEAQRQAEQAEADHRQSKTSSLHTADKAPYYIEQHGSDWVVVNKDGDIKGTHSSKASAREQQKAMYVNIPDASGKAEQAHGDPKPKVKASRHEATLPNNPNYNHARDLLEKHNAPRLDAKSAQSGDDLMNHPDLMEHPAYDAAAREYNNRSGRSIIDWGNAVDDHSRGKKRRPDGELKRGSLHEANEDDLPQSTCVNCGNIVMKHPDPQVAKASDGWFHPHNNSASCGSSHIYSPGDTLAEPSRGVHQYPSNRFHNGSLHEANQYIKKQGDEWVILQKGTGKVLSHHDSEEKANASFAAMEMNKHGGSVNYYPTVTTSAGNANYTLTFGNTFGNTVPADGRFRRLLKKITGAPSNNLDENCPICSKPIPKSEMDNHMAKQHPHEVRRYISMMRSSAGGGANDPSSADYVPSPPTSGNTAVPDDTTAPMQVSQAVPSGQIAPTNPDFVPTSPAPTTPMTPKLPDVTTTGNKKRADIVPDQQSEQTTNSDAGDFSQTDMPNPMGGANTGDATPDTNTDELTGQNQPTTSSLNRQIKIAEMADEILAHNANLSDVEAIHLASEAFKRTGFGGADWLHGQNSEGENLSRCPQCGKPGLSSLTNRCHACGYDVVSPSKSVAQ